MPEAPNFENLNDEQKAWLKHCLTGQIRNVLANEFGLSRGAIGRDAVRKVIADQAGDIIKAELRRHLSNERSLGKEVSAAISSIAHTETKKAIQEVVHKHLAERIEEAVDRITLNISLDLAPEAENPTRGMF